MHAVERNIFLTRSEQSPLATFRYKLSWAGKLTGKQPLAIGGRSAIRTGRSFRVGGIGFVGGTITSSKVYHVTVSFSSQGQWTGSHRRSHGSSLEEARTVLQVTSSHPQSSLQSIHSEESHVALSARNPVSLSAFYIPTILTGPSSENIAFGLSSCSWIRLSMSTLVPMTSLMLMSCFLSLPLTAVTVSRADGR